MNTATFQNSTTLHKSFENTYAKPSASPFANLISWCDGQEKNRLLWTGIMISLHGCILTPITVLLVAMAGVNMVLIGTSIFAMTFVLITNLAALPTRYTLPTFALSMIVDFIVLIVAYSI